MKHEFAYYKIVLDEKQPGTEDEYLEKLRPMVADNVGKVVSISFNKAGNDDWHINFMSQKPYVEMIWPLFAAFKRRKIISITFVKGSK